MKPPDTGAGAGAGAGRAGRAEECGGIQAASGRAGLVSGPWVNRAQRRTPWLWLRPRCQAKLRLVTAVRVVILGAGSSWGAQGASCVLVGVTAAGPQPDGLCTEGVAGLWGPDTRAGCESTHRTRVPGAGLGAVAGAQGERGG